MRLRLSARTTAIVACAAIAFAGLVGGAVRVLPWLLDPAVPWRVAAPFARGLAAVAMEAALVVGWPIGWAVACFRFVERGEARVFQSLGERPGITLARLAPDGIAFAVALAAVSLVWGRDASAPGTLATELVSKAGTACAAAHSPTPYAIPFTSLTWLCVPNRQPRLFGSAPGTLSSAVFSAAGARIAGDFRGLDLSDAHVLLQQDTAISIHVATLSIRGMPPWAHASTIPAALRAFVLAVAAAAAATLASHAVLRGIARTRLGALVLGAAGPVGALGLMRLLERAGARPIGFALVPLAGAALTVALVAAMSRLHANPWGASK